MQHMIHRLASHYDHGIGCAGSRPGRPGLLRPSYERDEASLQNDGQSWEFFDA